jgi:hypothetical protein
VYDQRSPAPSLNLAYVMQHLKDNGLDDNTIVMFTTNNGHETFTCPMAECRRFTAPRARAMKADGAMGVPRPACTSSTIGRRNSGAFGNIVLAHRGLLEHKRSGGHESGSTSPLVEPRYAEGRAIKSASLGSSSATVRGRPKLAANTSGGFEASHALRSWE